MIGSGRDGKQVTIISARTNEIITTQSKQSKGARISARGPRLRGRVGEDGDFSVPKREAALSGLSDRWRAKFLPFFLRPSACARGATIRLKLDGGGKVHEFNLSRARKGEKWSE